MASREDRSTHAGDVIFLPVALTAFWTLAYQLVLLTRLPTWSILPIFIFFLLAGAWGGRRSLEKMPWDEYEFHPAHLFLLVLGLACGVTVLFVLRPNQDDIVYFHRALTQLSHLADPILTRQTSVDVDAAAFSPVHLATSHEILMALLGHLLGVDPLYFYQVVGHVIAAFSMPFVFYFCARCFGLSRVTAAAGAAFAVAFLLIDDSGSAAFGSTAFARMWQGKAVVWALTIPVAISLTYRFMTNENWVEILWLTLLGVSTVGLSNSALYLIPAAVGSSSLAALASHLIAEKSATSVLAPLKRSMLLAIPLIYPVGILFLLALNIIPKPIDRHGFGPEFIPWSQGIEYVVGKTKFLWRDVAILILVPCFILRGRRRAFCLFYSCVILVLCLNPLLAHFWMKNITAACYFRLVYLMPLPLLFVFLPLAFEKGPRPFFPASIPGVATILVIAVLIVATFRSLTITPRSAKLPWKRPLDCQLIPSNVEFARAAGPYLAHSKLLTPTWTAGCELPLLFPHMKIVAPRLAMHYFANAGKPEEGSLRRMAQAYVEGEEATTTARKAALARSFETVVTSGRATAIALAVSESARVLATLQRIDPRWHRVLEAGGLVLIVPDAPVAGRTAQP